MVERGRKWVQGFLWNDGNVLEVNRGGGWKHHEYTKCHWTVHSKTVTFMSSEFHLNTKKKLIFIVIAKCIGL